MMALDDLGKVLQSGAEGGHVPENSLQLIQQLLHSRPKCEPHGAAAKEKEGTGERASEFTDFGPNVTVIHHRVVEMPQFETGGLRLAC